MWFNNENARGNLLSKGRVFTLRPKPYRLAKHLTSGTDVLMWSRMEKRGMVYFYFLKTIEGPEDLLPFLPDSGFDSVDDWFKAAGENRHLFLVHLIWSKRGEWSQNGAGS